MSAQPVVYGPAYLDIILETDRPLAPPGSTYRLDQSLPASQMEPKDDAKVVVSSSAGDCLRLALPPAHAENAGIYHLSEAILARTLGTDARQAIVADYRVISFLKQIGGMGAGYAKALAGMLRLPIGPDAVGERIRAELHQHGVQATPSVLAQSASDTSLVIISPAGEKLAIGVRDAIVHWQPDAGDRALARSAHAVVLCGAPNAFAAEVLSWGIPGPVMYAPAMRNVVDAAVPIVDLAQHIDYLALNALEWEYLDGKEELIRAIPVISVTDGPHGSRVYARDEEYVISAVAYDEMANTNRAGETYGSTFLKVLLTYAPEFHRAGISREIVIRAGEIASQQATRQLAISGFAFPPDDWM